ncbi:c-type cytochrome [Flavobacterium franklandianum]|uniref:C-type cytochrome n=1 Tax=Flavobacterium franklandianum TaxID=2594430 RepID=A0A553CT06_9FLAO|nr:c-type cytochrome [Flavobacterium franklandianum]TRX23668.1 c-type cytochrome [Flavobacterium franklandianum]TRX27036.1 c-type cytochrome [Flavobacterium franklandianum]
MKKVILPMLLAGMLTIVSCKKDGSEESFGKPETTTETTSEIQKPEDLGKEIFNGKGACIACHKPDVKLIGPSLQVIAKTYKEKKGDMVTFLKGEGEPIVDPTQYELMKPNLVITKTFSDEELKALEAYIYTNLK